MARTRSSHAARRVQRQRRHKRIRKKVQGSADRPRLVVFRSLRNIEGQLVDDEGGRTVIGLSTLDPQVRDWTPGEDDNGSHRRIGQALAAGKLLAERAREKGVAAVVFDRGGYRYHGRVKAFAEGARQGGLEF